MRIRSCIQSLQARSSIVLCAALLLPATLAWSQSHPAASPRDTSPPVAAKTNANTGSVFAWSQESPAVLSSPDGRLAIGFQTNGAGHLTYTVAFQGKTVLEQSGLSLDLQGQRTLGANVHIVNATASEADENYRLVTGKADSVTNHYRTLLLEVEENAAPQRRLEIEARSAYNDAVAFRYVVPQQEALDGFQLTAEHTEFRLQQGRNRLRPAPAQLPVHAEMRVREAACPARSPTRAVSPARCCAAAPCCWDLPGVAWMAITEADVRNYSLDVPAPTRRAVGPATGSSRFWRRTLRTPTSASPARCRIIPHGA